ncbi:PKD domain-containing protein, partial [Bacillus sp. FJAT-27264]|uniref:PKD domain-containing protein n=1 Tax=Paenibacillus sp. (strain DSM 101736 / FJAT-27264) TaxID=1850362 RepID=UPI000AEC58D7
MKKLFISLICILMLVSLAPSSEIFAAASISKQGSISIPVNTGLTGANNSAKSFTLDLPSGVAASSINASSLKYNGNNQVSSLQIVNGKIQVTLLGTANQKILSNVKGYRASYEALYWANPYNSIWRYSDGQRWQINEYDENTNGNKTYDLKKTDSGNPSANPPDVTVSAAPFQDMDYIKWYNGSVTEVVDNSSIIPGTIKPQIGTGTSAYLKDTPKFKNGRVIITYYIPSYIEKEHGKKVFLPYVNQSGDATHPLTGDAEGRKFDVSVYYYYTADAKVTTYSYSGNVTFDYTPPSEPTLNGTATLEKPSPNPAKLEGKKVDVKINVKGDLLGYSDTSNIEEWVFYAKEKGKTSADMKKEYNKVLATSKSFDFEIPDIRVTSDNFKQDYSLTVVVRFKKPVPTKAGKTITSLEQSMDLSAGVYRKDNPISYPSVPSKPTKPEGKPPIARISAPKYIKAGDDMMVYGGASSDPDGYITDYAWGTHGAQGEIGNTPRGYVWYTRDQVGQTFPITLTVVDNDGLTGSTSTEVTVIEPIPSASLQIYGSLKQNRKTTLTNTSQSPTRFPIIKSKTWVTISAISGGTNTDIRYSGSLAELESKDVLFKKPGKYKATIHVENTAGYGADGEITFDIAPDEVPFAYFSVPGKTYRDPSNWNKAVVSIEDMSFSPDKDNIVRRIWEYRYDSNNNGIFTDEVWVTFDEENKTRLNLELYKVGKYEIRLTVIEEFGQPTIEEFVSDNDRQRINSEKTQNVIERIVEVNNRAPEV